MLLITIHYSLLTIHFSLSHPSHAACCSEGCENSCCDARYELHDPLEGFLLRHSLPPFHFYIIHLTSYFFHRLATGFEAARTACALFERLGGYLAGLTVLDGDSLHGSRVAQSEASLIQSALC